MTKEEIERQVMMKIARIVDEQFLRQCRHLAKDPDFVKETKEYQIAFMEKMSIVRAQLLRLLERDVNAGIHDTEDTYAAFRWFYLGVNFGSSATTPDPREQPGGHKNG